MATYKLIQDIEAEDHILGPLTFRQFIFGLIAIFFFYLSFVAFTKHVSFLLVLFLPPALFFAFFAFPFGKDQPTEVWFLAKLRFWFLPRRRTWNQSGVKELVTITAPKKIEKVLTNNLSQTEVKSRLQALASTLDSRGWAVKGVDVFAPPAMAVVGGSGDSSDRLIGLNNFSQAGPAGDAPADDVLDDENSQVAQQMQSMIKKSSQAYHQKLADELKAVGQAQSAQGGGWFMGKSAGAPVTQQPQNVPVTEPPQVAAPPAPPAPAAAPPTAAASTPMPADEAALVEQLEEKAANQEEVFERMHAFQPTDAQPAPVQPPPAAPQNDPAILSLANNDDLNISTIANEAKKASDENDSPDEVVIKLH